jgi:hypothetical protein
MAAWRLRKTRHLGFVQLVYYYYSSLSSEAVVEGSAAKWPFWTLLRLPCKREGGRLSGLLLLSTRNCAMTHSNYDAFRQLSIDCAGGLEESSPQVQGVCVRKSR